MSAVPCRASGATSKLASGGADAGSSHLDAAFQLTLRCPSADGPQQALLSHVRRSVALTGVDERYGPGAAAGSVFSVHSCDGENIFLKRAISSTLHVNEVAGEAACLISA